MADHPSHLETSTDLPELSIVRLKIAATDGDVTYAPGTIGTIVHVHTGHNAYIVEFSDPESGVVSLKGADIDLVRTWP